MSWHLDSELPGCQLGLSWVSEATDPGRDTEGGPGKAFGWERGASRLRRFSCALSLVLHAWDADDAWIPTLVSVIASRSLTLSAFSRTRCMHQPIESSSV